MFFLIIFYIQIVNCLHLPRIWNKVSSPFKNKARNWFIDRAENLGIPWNDLKNKYVEPNTFRILEENKNLLENKEIIYPTYYQKPFHGYDKGNLNWLAAQEADAATLNIAAGYWPHTNPYIAQDWLRNNITNSVKKYLNIPLINLEYPNDPYNILDIGCSIGYSTEYFQDAFPQAKIFGLDLSPYFLSIANYRSNLANRNITYVHDNAENIKFSNMFRIICCNFLFHEVPRNATLNILYNIYDMIEPNGIIVITDLEPDVLKYDENSILTPFRKWMFEMTEPHILSYYDNDMKTLLKETGFTNIEKIKNDPVNSVWIATKK